MSALVRTMFALGLIACGGRTELGTRGTPDAAAEACDTTISASDYDQSCQVDAECIGVYSGSDCENDDSVPCPCPNAAIANKSSADAYYARADVVNATCRSCGAGGRSCLCANIEVRCKQGTCAPL